MQVHDPVRQMDGDVYFACTDFTQLARGSSLRYRLLVEARDGELTVFRTKVHKEPRQSLFGWYKHPRYTFVGDDIEYLYESD